MTSAENVRVRFCPSPTGTPHVGLARTALFNFAQARHVGGTFVFRIEDTDAARDSQESYDAILDALRWLGLDWDEGPEVGGDYGPYRQSERKQIHLDVVAKLLEAGEAYEAYSTNEEVEARHKAAGRDPKLGYDNFDRDLTDEQRAAFRAEGRKAVIRLRMPDEDLTWDDLVRGTTTIKAGTVPDFALTRGAAGDVIGDPLYTLVNPVDDAMMKITHVLRGEDLLSSTPRQIALYRALMRLGIADRVPEFGHLPFVMGEGNKKLSKRDPESSLFHHRDRGFIPEGLLNYLALLGWGISGDHDIFTLDEMIEAFDVRNVNSNPARFDQKKADSINAEHLRRLEPADFAARLQKFLIDGGQLSEPVDAERWAVIADLVQTRIQVLGDAWGLIKFLFVSDDDFAYDEKSVSKNLGGEATAVLDAAIAACESVDTWDTPTLEESLKTALVDGLELKPRKAFGPVRVGVTGAAVSPPLYESMELLGREKSLARLRQARELSASL
ncbi:glutamate--tRNA ligase [Gordonia neofelifaecis]|uniref:Glutamate--tRNA ligase n=1 Tax=Gordonia neofelifaecis NRRL B-59395 TaxID=644548 RepID=F1YEZ5_9ACTN|nr:glutamate--tRNA ligase [Gordonia neofelifaecis]EGD56979.1 glutamyl-tRNA synthetase [Gordonia neofelifaecis NRRL B-59395]